MRLTKSGRTRTAWVSGVLPIILALSWIPPEDPICQRGNLCVTWLAWFRPVRCSCRGTRGNSVRGQSSLRPMTLQSDSACEAAHLVILSFPFWSWYYSLLAIIPPSCHSLNSYLLSDLPVSTFPFHIGDLFIYFLLAFSLSAIIPGWYSLSGTVISFSVLIWPNLLWEL